VGIRKKLVSGAAATLMAAAVLSLVGVMAPAGATGSPSGSILPSSAVPNETYTANAPFSSGQLIDVQVPANSIFTSNNSIRIIECSAPGGVIPTDTSECDGPTIQGPTVHPRSDGSIDLVAQHYGAYNVYALPDALSLGEQNGPVCNQTTECILFIGVDQSDFTAPHYWSQPFYVAPNSDDLGENPGDGTAAFNPTLGSGSGSGLVATSANALSNGTATDTLTATLKNGNGQALSGKTISLGQASGHSVITPSSAVTSASGAAQFTVTDTTSEAVTYTATDTTDGVAITQTATVTFAGSVGSPSGSTLPSSAVPSGAFTANRAFSSGQSIDVKVPANSVFTSNEDVNILECSAPHGVIPTDPSACDGNTIQGPTVHPKADGSIDMVAQNDGTYQVYSTPDTPSLQETSSAPKCNIATECILYIGLNQGDFTQPHYWSQPFYVISSAGDSGANPGDGVVATPSVTLAPTTASIGGSVSYTATVSGTNGTPTGTVTVSDNKAPVCMITLSGGTGSCSISETASASPYSVTAAYSGDNAYTTGSASTNGYVSGVSASCSPPTIFPGNSATATAGQAFSFSVGTCSNSVKTVITGTGFPSGLKLTNNKNGTATIAGTPSATDSGVSHATVTVSASSTSVASESFTLTVDNVAKFLDKGKGTTVAGVTSTLPITTEYAYPAPVITTSALPTGMVLHDNGDGTAVLGGTPDLFSGGIYSITVTATNGIGAPVSQTYALTVYQLPVITVTPPTTVTAGTPITPIPVGVTGYPLPKTVATGLPVGLKLIQGAIAGTVKQSVTPGPYTVTLTSTNKAGSVSTTFTVILNSPPIFVDKGIGTTVAGQPSTLAITTEYGSPAPVITTSALPSGMVLQDNGNGTAVLGGTPDLLSGGVYSITVTATNGIGAPVSQTYALTVNQLPVITVASSVTVTRGSTITPIPVQVTGFPTPVDKASGLPAGLAFVGGNITGTVKSTDATGSYTVTITATSKAGTTTKTFSVTVQ
jgi:Bacterial Ig-like domain (group 1)/Bacterial Ig-like domain (group 3)/Putative Ig domain